jgi:hypothetical protein
MKPEQALLILAQCAAQAPLPDSIHNQWKEAVKILREVLEKSSK